ncbi:MAG: NADH-quinone oxidoreductase subunit K [Elusimicrobiota bacterium]
MMVAGMLQWYGIFIVLLFVVGLYCIITTTNLIRLLIGIEILIKAVTLLFALAGWLTGNTALSQVLIITLIVVEVVIMVVAGGLIVNVYRHTKSIESRGIKNLKG